MSTGDIVLSTAWSAVLLAVQTLRLSSHLVALHGRESVRRNAPLGWLWSISRFTAPPRRLTFIIYAATFPIFPLTMAVVAIGTAQLIALAGSLLSLLVSIFALAADGDLRERARPHGPDGL